MATFAIPWSADKGESIRGATGNDTPSGPLEDMTAWKRFRSRLVPVVSLLAVLGGGGTAPSIAQVLFDDVRVRSFGVQAELYPAPFAGVCHDANCTSSTQGRIRAATVADIEVVGDRPVTGIRLLLDADLRVTNVVSSPPATVRRDRQFVFLSYDPPLAQRSLAKVTIEYEGSPAWIWDELILAGEGLLYPVIINRFGDIAANRAPIALRLTLPSGYSLASFGRPRQLESGGTTAWEWPSTNPLSQLSVVGLRTSRAAERTAGPLRLTIFSRQEADVQIDVIVDLVAKTAEFYSRLLYAFPLTDLSVVLAPFPRGVMGFGAPGVLVIPEAPFGAGADVQNRDSARLLSIAREMAHAYYPVSSNGKGPAALWLSEGLSEYLGLMAVEALLGREDFVRELDAHRRAYASIAGPAYCVPPWCIPDQPLSAIDRTNARLSGARIVVASKGAFVLHMLRYLMGTPAFTRMVGSFTQRFRDQSVAIGDLSAFASDAFGEDLLWFFQEWVLDRALPDYTVPEATSLPTGGEYRTVIRIRNLGTGGLPVDVLIRTELGDRLIRRFPVPGSIVGGETLVTVVTPQRVVEIEVDPEKWILQSDYTNDRLTLR